MQFSNFSGNKTFKEISPVPTPKRLKDKTEYEIYSKGDIAIQTMELQDFSFWALDVVT